LETGDQDDQSPAKPDQENQGMWVVHVDIDAFFASVEQLLVPALRGKPVAVGSGCIASCSYEARKFGLHAGMPLSKARELCPRLAIVPGSFGIYRCFRERVFDLCREVAPSVETYLDDAYLDLAGTERLYADPCVPIAELRARIREETGLAATAGIGPNRMLARLAGRDAKPDGLGCVRAEEAEAFLADRPADDIPGVGPRTAALLARFNVRTVRDLRALPRDTLIRLFGRTGDALYDRARGLDTRPVSPREVPKSISRETAFHRETADPVEIRAMLSYLLERALKTARELSLAARTVSVKLAYADFQREDGRVRLPFPTDLDADALPPALALFSRLYARRVALHSVGVALSGLTLLVARQPNLFEPERDRRARLADALDAVRGKFGFSSITAGKAIALLGKLRQDSNGYVLRTPCLTK
jgi:DNA polymerase-4